MFDDFNDEFDISLPKEDEPAQKKADLFDDDFDDGDFFDDAPKKQAPKFDDLDFDFWQREWVFRNSAQSN